MSIKLFTACLATETHTSGPLPTGEIDFETAYLVRDGKHPDALNMFGAPLVTWRNRAKAKGWNVIESLCTFATPSGLVVKATHEKYREEILKDLKAAMPVDVIMLSLHGAMVADGCDDCEGDLVRRVREIVGPNVPIGVEYDLHCHISRQFIENVTALVIYKEYPHTDYEARAEELWEIIEATVERRIKPLMTVADCRMIGLFHTTREPMQSFVLSMKRLEEREGILSVSLGHGFPWGDVPEEGARVIVITDDRPELGREVADRLARDLWNIRDEITPCFLDMDDAITKAQQIEGGPITLADISDNPGGGAAGDSTFLVSRLIERGVKDVAVGGIWDPVAVQICISAGQGAKFNLRLGGKSGPASGTPLDLFVEVLTVELDFHVKSHGGGTKRYMGDVAVVRSEGVDFVLHTARCQNTDTAFFSAFNIDISTKKILVVKSMQHFYNAYASVSKEVIYTASPACLRWDFATYPYTKLARPVWPLDGDPWVQGIDRPW